LKELWVPLSGALAQQRKVETIANNVANANTTAFKRDQLAFKEYLTAQQKGIEDIDLPNKEWAPEDFYRSYGAENSMVEVQGSYTNFSQGQIRPTNNPLDVAINGQGFIEVLTPNGIRFTRNGSFTVSNNGELTTKEGYPILSKRPFSDNESSARDLASLPKPKERIIRLDDSPLSINEQGQIFQKNQIISHISIVEFKDTDGLMKEGKSFFINNERNNILGPKKTRILQGSLETSNVNAIKEMSDLIKAHRNFETMQKVIKTYDSMASKAYNEIGKF